MTNLIRHTKDKGLGIYSVFLKSDFETVDPNSLLETYTVSQEKQ